MVVAHPHTQVPEVRPDGLGAQAVQTFEPNRKPQSRTSRGPGKVSEEPDDFTPHVSLAHSNRSGDAQPIVEAALSLSPRYARRR
jgi:hypothetical protein